MQLQICPFFCLQVVAVKPLCISCFFMRVTPFAARSFLDAVALTGLAPHVIFISFYFVFFISAVITWFSDTLYMCVCVPFCSMRDRCLPPYTAIRPSRKHIIYHYVYAAVSISFRPLASHRGGPGSIPGLVKWDLWWGRFSPSTSVSPANLHSTNCSTITLTYHLGLVQ
jgi:hypothetical protein